ncbi:unnamed protein product [Tilletia controversa]|nr:unnamed protein product [Tilletia controversa]
MTKVGKTSDDIEKVKLLTQEAAYMVAVSLMNGTLTPDMYNDDYAANPKIDELRAKMKVKEEGRYTKEYMEPENRSIGNSVEVVFKDGSTIGRIMLDYVICEAILLIAKKLRKYLEDHFDEARESKIMSLIIEDHKALAAMPVSELVDLWLKA